MPRKPRDLFKVPNRRGKKVRRHLPSFDHIADPRDTVWREIEQRPPTLPPEWDHGHTGPGDGGDVSHTVLTDITPDDHHNQVHDLYGTDHGDVVTPLQPLEVRHVLGNGGGGGWQPEFRMNWRNRWSPLTYYTHDVVFDDGWLMVANKTTTDRAAPQPTGEEVFLYDGTNPEQQVTAKTLTIGQNYTLAVSGYATGYRVYTRAGNVYRVFLEVSGEVSELLLFTGTQDGWTEFSLNPIPLPQGTVFSLSVAIQEPDPTPVVLTADWDYQTPTGTTSFDGVWQVKRGNGNPGEGEAQSQTNGDFYIHIIDKDDGNRDAELGGLNPGDSYQVGGTLYTIQTIVRDGGGGGHYRITPNPTSRPQENEYNIVFTQIAYQVPASGQIVQNENLLDSLRVHKTPSAGGPIDLSGLSPGDIIEGPGGIRWAIQGITDQTDYWDFNVSPAQKGTPDGVATFNFETVQATPITTVVDTDFWLANPNITGFFGVDGGALTPTEDAYGIDLKVQNADISEDWDLAAAPASGSGGGGGDTFWTANGDDIYNANSGNVGIGVDAPSDLLQVGDGTVASDDWISIGKQINATSGIRWRRGPSNFDARVYVNPTEDLVIDYDFAGLGSRFLYFRKNSGPVMTLTSTGEVSINRLIGTGTRNVSANANGELVIDGAAALASVLTSSEKNALVDFLEANGILTAARAVQVKAEL